MNYSTFFKSLILESTKHFNMETHSKKPYDKDTGQYSSLREQCPQGNDKTVMSMMCHGAVTEN